MISETSVAPSSPDIEVPALCIKIFIYEKIWEKKFRADTSLPL